MEDKPLYHLPEAIEPLAQKAQEMRNQAEENRKGEKMNPRFIIFLVIFMLLLLGLGYLFFLSRKS